MKRILTLTTAFILLLSLHSFSQRTFAGSEEQVISTPPSVPVTVGVDTVAFSWTARSLASGLLWPWDLEMGKDDTLYFSEKAGRIGRVSKNGGTVQTLIDLRTSTFKTNYNTTPGSEAISQDGMLGMALHPNFNGNLAGGADTVYVAYTYNNAAIPYAHKRIRISKFTFNPGASPTLSNEKVIIQGIPASKDHSSGRLIFGPDGFLYYTCGDQGFNQFDSTCKNNVAQVIPTNAEITARNYNNYRGKILRISPIDSIIPANNPTINGVKSHIWSYGHRNPQGLVFEKNPIISQANTFQTLKAGGRFFDAEQMVRSDDEINIIDTAYNYGWPFTQGVRTDDNYKYVNWSSSGSCSVGSYSDNPNVGPAGASVYKENSTMAVGAYTYIGGSTNSVSYPSGYSQLNNPSGSKGYKEPIATLFTSCGTLVAPNCDVNAGSYLQYPTVATSSIEHYSYINHIIGWENSLLVTTLKRGRVYMMNIDSVLSGSLTYKPRSVFATNNRYRDIVIDPDGKTFYLICDRAGQTSGPTSGGAATSPRNPGYILRFTVIGGALGISPDINNQVTPNLISRIYPNPADKVVVIETSRELRKPCTYMVVDMAGRAVINGTTNKDKFEINTSSLRNGMYLLRIFNAFGAVSKTEKIIVNHR